jgi:RNA polymerase sigma-70 factor (ECF subfamily)
MISDQPPQIRAWEQVPAPMTASTDLKQLLARVALGDRAAFRHLYDATAPSLFGVALRIVRQRDRAEEVLQDAFVNAWNRAAGYQAALSQPMTWLTAIVRNRALDELRSGARHRAESLEDGEGGATIEIEDARPNPLGLLEQAADALAIRDCLEAIDGPQRQCLALVYYHGLSHSEVAGRVGSPIGSVKVWLRRGLEKLKRCLEKLA